MKQSINLPEGMRKVEALIAIGLYKTRSESIKGSLKGLLSKYQVKPIHEVRGKLDEQVKGGLSEEIRRIREEEMY